MLGPIFPVELVTTARRARYYLMRVAYGLLLLLIIWLSFDQAFSRPQGVSLRTAAEFGETFFYMFAVLQLLAALVVTAAVTAGTIAEERERRTIEYLLVTSMSNAEIVLGKLASRLLHVIAFLATALPVLSITLLFGGTDLEQLLQLSVITLSSVLAAAGLSIFLSIWTTRPRHAVLRAFILMAGLFLLPFFATPLAMFQPSLYAWIAPINDQIVAANPLAFLMTMGNARVPPGIPLTPGWPGVLLMLRNHLVWCAVLVALAIWRVRAVHIGATTRARRNDRAAPRRWLWRPRLENWPMLWKELFGEPAIKELNIVGRLILLVLVLAIVIPIGRTFYMCYAGHYHQEVFQQLASVMSMVIGTAFLIVVAARAAGSITGEREKQTWDVLISTPLSAGEIVAGKTVGSMYALRWMLALLGLIWVLAAVLLPASVWRGAGTLLTIMLLCPVFSNLGFFCSMHSSSSSRAMVTALLVSLLVCGGYLVVLLPFLRGPIDRGGNQYAYAACAPWLVSWPGSVERHRGLARQDAQREVYAAGMVGYGVAGLGLMALNIWRFDRRSGRAHTLGPGPPACEKNEIEATLGIDRFSPLRNRRWI